MKIFLSWSGDRSHSVATIFNEWLPEVLTSVTPWISSQHISKGASWLSEIKDAIGASSGMGVFFLTPEALSSAWMLFEAGGVAALGEKKVCTVLVQVEAENVGSPWNTFQGTKLGKADLLKLVKDINARTPQPLAEPRLEKIFERAWPDLKTALDAALAANVVETGQPPEPIETPSALSVRIEAMSNGMQGVEARLGRLEEETQKANSQIIQYLIFIGNQVHTMYQPFVAPPTPGSTGLSDVAFIAPRPGNLGLGSSMEPTNALAPSNVSRYTNLHYVSPRENALAGGVKLTTTSPSVGNGLVWKRAEETKKP